jgi:hypothetical protein
MNEIFEPLNVIEWNDTWWDQEKTIECKTLEEYEMKKKAYLDSVFLQTLDVNHIMKNIALPAYRSQIKPERLKVLDKRIDNWTYLLNTNNVKYNIYSANFFKKNIQSLLKYSDNIIQIPNTGLFLFNEIKIEWFYWLLFSENVWARFLEGLSLSTDKINFQDLNYQEMDYKYVIVRLLVDFINKPYVVYDEPVKPLPPELLSVEKKKDLEITLETQTNKILLRDNTALIFKNLWIIEQKETQKSVNATLSKNIEAKQFLIWWETVDKKVFDMYSQYKKDRMIPSNQTWWTAPKPWTPKKYQNLSWEYFKTHILNKDEQYMVR